MSRPMASARMGNNTGGDIQRKRNAHEAQPTDLRRLESRTRWTASKSRETTKPAHETGYYQWTGRCEWPGGGSEAQRWQVHCRLVVLTTASPVCRHAIHKMLISEKRFALHLEELSSHHPRLRSTGAPANTIFCRGRLQVVIALKAESMECIANSKVSLTTIDCLPPQLHANGLNCFPPIPLAFQYEM